MVRGFRSGGEGKDSWWNRPRKDGGKSGSAHGQDPHGASAPSGKSGKPEDVPDAIGELDKEDQFGAWIQGMSAEKDARARRGTPMSEAESVPEPKTAEEAQRMFHAASVSAARVRDSSAWRQGDRVASAGYSRSKREQEAAQGVLARLDPELKSVPQVVSDPAQSSQPMTPEMQEKLDSWSHLPPRERPLARYFEQYLETDRAAREASAAVSARPDDPNTQTSLEVARAAHETAKGQFHSASLLNDYGVLDSGGNVDRHTLDAYFATRPTFERRLNEASRGNSPVEQWVQDRNDARADLRELHRLYLGARDVDPDSSF